MSLVCMAYDDYGNCSDWVDNGDGQSTTDPVALASVAANVAADASGGPTVNISASSTDVGVANAALSVQNQLNMTAVPATGLTQAQAQAQGLNWTALLAQAASATGTYVARSVGGQTVLYPNNTGGLSSLNLSSILPIALIGGALFLFSRSKSS